MVKEKAAGSFLGGFANNPGVIIIAVLAIALFLFRDRISNAFASVGEGFGNINIELPALPTIELPSLPQVPDVFGSVGGAVGEAGDQAVGFFEGIQQQIDDFISGIGGGDGEGTPMFPGAGTPEDPFIVPSGPPTGGVGIEDELEVVFTPLPDPEPLPASEQEGAITVPPGSALGGGPSFEGGTTTFGNLDEIVDTLSEVLQIFPSLTASQARDTLSEFPGLTFGEFAVIDPDIINITGGV